MRLFLQLVYNGGVYGYSANICSILLGHSSEYDSSNDMFQDLHL